MKNKLAVVMITFNEEYHIEAAIDNVSDIASEIYVLDSLSTDKTVEIALSKGAVVLQRPFTNFGDQWNFALSHFPIQSEWTMKLDPDERLSECLKSEILEVISQTQAEGYEMKRRLWFMGRPLRVQQRVLRLWKTGLCQFTNEIVNEHPLIEGRIQLLQGYMEHLDSRNLHLWMTKQNLYTSLEAQRTLEHLKLPIWEHRKLKKHDVFRLPFCFFWLYWYHLLGKGAIWSGRAGFAWARLRTERYRLEWYKVIEARTLQELYIPSPQKVKGEYNKEVIQSNLQQQIMRNPSFEGGCQ